MSIDIAQDDPPQCACDELECPNCQGDCSNSVDDAGEVCAPCMDAIAEITCRGCGGVGSEHRTIGCSGE